MDGKDCKDGKDGKDGKDSKDDPYLSKVRIYASYRAF